MMKAKILTLYIFCYPKTITFAESKFKLIMAVNKKQNQKEDPEAVIESALNRTEFFIERNGKKLLIALVIVVAIVGGYFGFEHLYKAPRSKKASAAMFQAQYQFEKDSFALALNGNASFAGFEEIAEQWGGTPEANLAAHYAGICHLYMGDYQTALDYFERFKSVSGTIGEIVTAQNYGLRGDAHIEMGNLEKGVAMYEKAASHSDNTDPAPTYLKKAAMVNEELGNNAKALDQYKSIRNNYPGSMIARDIDKYIAKVQQKL